MICDTEKQIFISWNIFWHYFFVKRQEFIFSLGSNGDSMYFEGYYWLKGHPVHDIGSSKASTLETRGSLMLFLLQKHFSATFSNVSNSPWYKQRIYKL